MERVGQDLFLGCRSRRILVAAAEFVFAERLGWRILPTKWVRGCGGVVVLPHRQSVLWQPRGQGFLIFLRMQNADNGCDINTVDQIEEFVIHVRRAGKRRE